MHPGGARFLRLLALGTQQGNFRQCPYHRGSSRRAEESRPRTGKQHRSRRPLSGGGQVRGHRPQMPPLERVNPSGQPVDLAVDDQAADSADQGVQSCGEAEPVTAGKSQSGRALVVLSQPVRCRRVAGHAPAGASSPPAGWRWMFSPTMMASSTTMPSTMMKANVDTTFAVTSMLGISILRRPCLRRVLDPRLRVRAADLGTCLQNGSTCSNARAFRSPAPFGRRQGERGPDRQELGGHPAGRDHHLLEST